MGTPFPTLPNAPNLTPDPLDRIEAYNTKLTELINSHAKNGAKIPVIGTGDDGMPVLIRVDDPPCPA